MEPSLETRLLRDAIPFSLHDGPQLDEAIDRVVAALGDEVDLLGFGEALHGGEELLLLRNRLFQRLVEAHGYRSIAIESSYPRSRRMNEYVTRRPAADGGPATYDDVGDAGVSHGFDKLEANRELIEWMRTYNAAPPDGVPLRFYGFDQPAVEAAPASPGELLHVALDYLAVVDADEAARRRAAIDAQLGDVADWQDVPAWRDPARVDALLARVDRLRIETERLASELQVRRAEPRADDAAERYAEAVHCTATARQFLDFFFQMARNPNFAGSLGVRDALMADNVVHIRRRERSRGKVFLFAHNKHLQRSQAVWRLGPMTCAWWPAGAHLHALLGPRYAVIGSAVGASAENGLAAPEEGSLEARLIALPGPGRFTPTHRREAASLPPGAADLPVRSGSPRNGSYFPLTAESWTDFDWWATLDAVRYNRGGRPLPPASSSAQG